MRRVRNIITIDEELCNGCGQCIVACAEGALALVDGKARLTGEIYCDGAGACLGHCPTGAMRIEQREAEDYSEAAVAQLTGAAAPSPAPMPQAHGGCPGAAARSFAPRAQPGSTSMASTPPQLGNWPVQLHLAPVSAPHYAGARLLLCADCVPFAYPEFHARMLAGRTLLIGCPKLDDAQAYVEKLARIFALNDIASVEVAFMEVPCCFGMVALVRQALSASGKQIPASAVRVGIGGELQASLQLDALP
jgi:ferredoxin